MYDGHNSDRQLTAAVALALSANGAQLSNWFMQRVVQQADRSSDSYNTIAADGE